MTQRSLEQFVEAGEREYTGSNLYSNILYFRVDYRTGGGPSNWLPVCDYRGKPIRCRSIKSSNRQLRHWTIRVDWAAANYNNSRRTHAPSVTTEVAWGWATEDEDTWDWAWKA